MITLAESTNISASSSTRPIYIFLLPATLALIVTASCIGQGAWSVFHFIVYTSLSFLVFVLFVLKVQVCGVRVDLKFKFCLVGGLISFLLALFFNELLLGVAVALDKHTRSAVHQSDPRLPVSLSNVWVETAALVICAFAEEVWKLKTVDVLLRDSSLLLLSKESVAVLGACAGFGFQIFENLVYFRVSGDDWRVGVGRSVSATHVMLASLGSVIAWRKTQRQFWLAVLVCGLFHAAHNVAVTVVEIRFQALLVGRLLVAGNLCLLGICLYLCLRL